MLVIIRMVVLAESAMLGLIQWEVYHQLSVPPALIYPLDQRTQVQEQLLPIAPGCVLPGVFEMQPTNAHPAFRVSVYIVYIYFPQ